MVRVLFVLLLSAQVIGAASMGLDNGDQQRGDLLTSLSEYEAVFSVYCPNERAEYALGRVRLPVYQCEQGDFYPDLLAFELGEESTLCRQHGRTGMVWKGWRCADWWTVVESSDRARAGGMGLEHVLVLGGKEPESSLLAWRPSGEQNASAIADGVEYVVDRGDFSGDSEVLGDARIYLKNDEVLACKLVSINENGVEFSSKVTGQTYIANSEIRAIDIEGAGLVTKGFGDPGWVLDSAENEGFNKDRAKPAEDQKDSTKLNKDLVTIKHGGFGHMNILTGDRIEFNVAWDDNGGGVFTVRLFCSDFGKSPSIDLLVVVKPNRVLVGEVKSGEFNLGDGAVSVEQSSADFEILAKPNKLEVLVNGKLTLELEIDPKQVSGNGLAFEMGGGFAGWSDHSTVIKFSEFVVGRSSGYLPRSFINTDAKTRALLVPRFHRENPPTHVLVAPNGDLLRGKLRSAQGNIIAFTSRGKDIEVPKSRVSAIIWLIDPVSGVSEKGEPDQARQTNSVDNDIKPFHPTHYVVLKDGSRLLLESLRIDAAQGVFVGRSNRLGECRVPLAKINRSNVLISTNPLSRPISSDQLTYRDWKTQQTPDPAIPNGNDPGSDSPLIGKVAPLFTVPMLNGSDFNLAEKKGKVVVLDFWATWCGPCIRAMPEVFRAIDFFKGRGVEFCAINQAETAPLITEFLERRKWSSDSVGLDFQLNVGRDYQVQGIPHTVVIGKDGKIAWVHSGFTPDLGEKLATAIAKELAKEAGK